MIPKTGGNHSGEEQAPEGRFRDSGDANVVQGDVCSWCIARATDTWCQTESNAADEGRIERSDKALVVVEIDSHPVGLKVGDNFQVKGNVIREINAVVCRIKIVLGTGNGHRAHLWRIQEDGEAVAGFQQVVGEDIAFHFVAGHAANGGDGKHYLLVGRDGVEDERILERPDGGLDGGCTENGLISAVLRWGKIQVVEFGGGQVVCGQDQGHQQNQFFKDVHEYLLHRSSSKGKLGSQ